MLLGEFIVWCWIWGILWGVGRGIVLVGPKDFGPQIRKGWPQMHTDSGGAGDAILADFLGF